MSFAINGYLVDNKVAGDFLADGDVVEVLESECVFSGGALVAKGDFVYVPITGGIDGGFWGVGQNTPAAATDYVSLKTRGIFVLDVDSQDNAGNEDIGFGDAVTVAVATGVLSRDGITAGQQTIGIALPNATISGDSALHLTPVLLISPGTLTV